MIARVKMPKLSENDEEQTVTAWLKKEGDTVSKGEPLATITTSKAAFELESPKAGLVRAILAPANSSVPIGFVIALVGPAEEPLPDVAAGNRKLMAARTVKAAPAAGAAGTAAAAPGALRATPAARRLARERGLDLAQVQARFNLEVVTEAAVEKYAAERVP